MRKQNLEEVFSLLSDVSEEKMYGEVTLIFKNGEVVLVKKSTTEKIKNGRTGDEHVRSKSNNADSEKK